MNFKVGDLVKPSQIFLEFDWLTPRLAFIKQAQDPCLEVIEVWQQDLLMTLVYPPYPNWEDIHLPPYYFEDINSK